MLQRGQYSLENARWAWRAARHGDIDWNDVRYAAASGVILPENAAGAAAISQRHHQLRIGRRRVSTLKSILHVFGDGARDEQDVCMARAGNEADPEAFQIIDRIVERLDFELTAVARARVDMADTQRTAEHGANALRQPRANAQGVVRGRRRLTNETDRRDVT